MRPLAYAALSLALAGCSLPYVATSFKAQPELEAALRGRGKKEEGGEGEKQVEVDPFMHRPDTDGVPSAGVPADGSIGRTGLVFPPTAQPATTLIDTGLTPKNKGFSTIQEGDARTTPKTEPKPVPANPNVDPDGQRHNGAVPTVPTTPNTYSPVPTPGPTPGPTRTP